MNRRRILLLFVLAWMELFATFLTSVHLYSGENRVGELPIQIALLTLASVGQYLMLNFRRLRLCGPVLEWRQFPEARNIPLSSILRLDRFEFWQGVVVVRYWYKTARGSRRSS